MSTVEIKDTAAKLLEAKFRHAVDRIEDNMAMQLSAEIREYDASWCSEDTSTPKYAKSREMVDEAIRLLVKAELECLFENR